MSNLIFTLKYFEILPECFGVLQGKSKKKKNIKYVCFPGKTFLD